MVTKELAVREGLSRHSFCDYALRDEHKRRDFVFDSNLALYVPLWHPELTGSSIVSKDLNAITGTVTGATWSRTGRTFDAVDDRIDFGNNVRITGAISIAAWFNTSVVVGNQSVIAKVSSAGAQRSYRLDMDNGRPNLFVSPDGSGTGVGGNACFRRSNDTYNDGIWHFFGGIFTPDESITIAIDGTEPASTLVGSVPSGIYDSTTSVYIGYMFDADADVYFGGDIGEVWVYSSALGVNDLHRMYRATKWRYI